MIVTILSAKAVDFVGETLLHFAAKAGNLQTVQFLLGQGADVNAASRGGFTPLYLAVGNDNIDVAKLLLEKGANLEALTGRFQSTALHNAVELGLAQMVQLLLNQGARTDVVDLRKQTPVDIAIKNGNQALVQIFSSMFREHPFSK